MDQKSESSEIEEEEEEEINMKMCTRVPKHIDLAAKSAPHFTAARAACLRGAEENCAPVNEVPSIVHEVLRSPGQPLDPANRAFMEPRFGHDFGKVRVHTDTKAAESARALNARAYATGENLVFGSGQYTPGTTAGQRLLAHELAHVVQQSGQAGLEAPKLQGQEDKEPWVKDRDGNLYYKTEAEAKLRLAALQKEAAWSEYRVTSFVLKKETYWRVEMRGPKKLAGTKTEEKAPEGKTSETSQKSAEEEKTKQEGAEEEKTKQESESGSKVCLTFDDGPQSGTAEVLDALSSKSAPATFFLTGKNMESNQSTQKTLVERMLTEGHQIGNHTFTHDPMTLKGYEKAYGDLSDPAKLKKFQENYTKNEDYFKTLLGTKFSGFDLARLPGDGRFVKAHGNLILVIATEGMGMAHVSWQFEYAPNNLFGHLKVLDWKGVKGVAAEEDKFPTPNAIILLHDKHWAGKKSLLTEILTKLEKNGFSFGKLDGKGKCT